MTVDWRLYYVTDPSLAGGRDKVASTVEQAVLGGATVVQFRDKEADDQAFRQGVLACQKAIERAVTKGAAGAELFVNDRLEVATSWGRTCTSASLTAIRRESARGWVLAGCWASR